MKEKSTNEGLDSRAIHAGEPHPRIEGAVVAPTFLSSTYEFTGAAAYGDVKYARLSNTPNHVALNAKIASLEEAEAALVTGSGMSAISSALLAVVGPGEHLLAQADLYGGTHHYLTHYWERMGRQVSFYPTQDLAALEKAIQPNTRAIYVESISNPLLSLPDLAGVVRVAKARGITTLIDNTFPSPVNFNPIPFGFDLALHSATKYLNGHSDVVAGAVVGSRALVAEVRGLVNHMGGSLDPNSCYLMNRGLKTLGVRVRAQNERAQELAEALGNSPAVERVVYPGLTSHPQHGRAKEWFRGFGGVVTFFAKRTPEEIDRALGRLRYGAVAPSLGGVETLVTRPATTSHSGLSAEERRRVGVTDNLVRVSVGLESPKDLIEDFLKALG